MTDLSLILPVHNEADGIGAFLLQTKAVLEKMRISYEILCVENGSTDGSFAILKKIAAADPNIRVLESPKGWGNAVREGLRIARGRYIAYMVSDGQIDPAVLPVLYGKILGNSVSMVKVWRTKRENMPRLFNSRAYNMLSRMVFGLPSRDINATPKMMPAQLLKTIPLTAPNIAVDLELLTHMYRRGYTWEEIPVPSLKRSGGVSTTNIKSVFEMMGAMVRLRLFGKLGC